MCLNDQQKLCKGNPFKNFNSLIFKSNASRQNKIYQNDFPLFCRFSNNKGTAYSPNEKTRIKHIQNKRHSQEPFILISEDNNFGKNQERANEKRLNTQSNFSYNPELKNNDFIQSIGLKYPNHENLLNYHSYVFGEKNPISNIKAHRNKKSLMNPKECSTVVNRLSAEKRRKPNLFYNHDIFTGIHRFIQNDEKQNFKKESKSRGNVLLIIDQKDKFKQFNLFNHISYSKITKWKNVLIKKKFQAKIISSRESRDIRQLFHKKNNEYYNKVKISRFNGKLHDSISRNNIDY